MYDDPSLGGTGESAWNLDEMEQLLGVPIQRTHSGTDLQQVVEGDEEDEDEEGEYFKRKRASIAYMESTVVTKAKERASRNGKHCS